MNKKVIALAVLCVVVLAVGISTRVVQKKQLGKDAGPVMPVVKVTKLRTETKMAQLAVNGSIEALQDVMISSKLAGRIQDIYVDDGQYVSTGQALVKLESLELQNSVRMAEAQLVSTGAALKEATTNHRRYQELLDKGAISQQTVDAMQTRLQADQSQYNVAKASLANAYEQLANNTVTAPVSGYVANKTVALGNVVSPGQLLMQVSDISSVYLTVNVPQKEFARIIPGQPAKISVDAYPERTFSGVVNIVNPVIGNTARSFKLKLKINNSDGALKPGMFAKADIEFGNPETVTLVPLKAIVNNDGRNCVYIYDNGVAKEINVELGSVYGNEGVIKGINTDQQVIIEGIHLLKNNMAVKLQQ